VAPTWAPPARVGATRKMGSAHRLRCKRAGAHHARTAPISFLPSLITGRCLRPRCR
jgi:hypothetical protein